MSSGGVDTEEHVDELHSGSTYDLVTTLGPHQWWSRIQDGDALSLKTNSVAMIVERLLCVAETHPQRLPVIDLALPRHT